MLNKKTIVGAAIVLVVAVLGIIANTRPPKLPQEAQQAMDDFAQRFEGQEFGYQVVSAEKATVVEADTRVDKLQAYPGFGGGKGTPGICPPGGDILRETWCLIIDKEVETPSGDSYTHFVLQRQGILWQVQGVPSSGSEVFQIFGCRKW
jgi:hypothetical protein